MLGFYNPNCYGMIHHGTTAKSIKGETITIHPNAFLDKHGKLISDKKVLIYVTNANTDSDVAQSSA